MCYYWFEIHFVKHVQPFRVIQTNRQHVRVNYNVTSSCCAAADIRYKLCKLPPVSAVAGPVAGSVVIARVVIARVVIAAPGSALEQQLLAVLISRSLGDRVLVVGDGAIPASVSAVRSPAPTARSPAPAARSPAPARAPVSPSAPVKAPVVPVVDHQVALLVRLGHLVLDGHGQSEQTGQNNL